MANNAKNPQINLLLTRPKAGAEAFWGALTSEMRQVVTPVFSPLLEITALDPELGVAGPVIFSSVNGVMHSPKGNARTAFCVGAMTTKVANEAGWKAFQCGDTADQLIEFLAAAHDTAPLIHLCGVHTRGNIAERLTREGCPTQRISVYDQAKIPLNRLAIEVQHSKFPLLVPLFSPRTASNFALQSTGCAPLHIIALSHDVAYEVKGLRSQTLTVPGEPTRAAMIEAVQNVIRSVALG